MIRNPNYPICIHKDITHYLRSITFCGKQVVYGNNEAWEVEYLCKALAKNRQNLLEIHGICEKCFNSSAFQMELLKRL